ncbi:MAG: spondin domain-containing protein [Gammaproteobacteria bacterium]|nr:spondin domain-containing protein [Gammaproteobacteria bacterium]
MSTIHRQGLAAPITAFVVCSMLSVADADEHGEDSLTPSPPDPTAADRSEANYDIIFTGTWTTESTPDGLPATAHFSPLIGAVHNDSVVFLDSGEMASAGVESMAELGRTGALRQEINAAGTDASSVLAGLGNLGPEETEMLAATALSTDHPRVTLVTMIAPSPDWFVGISGLSLLDAAGEWRPSATLSLYPWDAGTEDGTEFSLNNPPTNPQGVIESIRGEGKFSERRMAALSLSLKSVTTGSGGPEVATPIDAQSLAVGERPTIPLAAAFHDAAARTLAFSAVSLEPEVAAVSVTGDSLSLSAVAPGNATVLVTASEPEGATATFPFPVDVTGAHRVWLFPAASDAPRREGFVRVVNRSSVAGTVTIQATDEDGAQAPPVTLAVGPRVAAQFNSTDLEAGNSDKGLSGAAGSGQGDWRLDLTTDLDVEVRSYLRAENGFLTAMDGVAPVLGEAHRVAFFNPGSNARQASVLRIVNPGDEDATVSIQGIDDAGTEPGEGVEVRVPAGGVARLAAADMETGKGLDGSLGDGIGKWRLTVTADRPVVVQSVLETPTGHLANLSGVPRRTPGQGQHAWYFPAATDPHRRQGFLRVINRSTQRGEVRIAAVDDEGMAPDPLVLSLEAGAVAAFNSSDLEEGNDAKGLSGGVGTGSGAWRLALSGDLAFDAVAYIRTADGFVTSMYRTAPRRALRHRVAIFNPASNADQVSRLRIVNPGPDDAQIAITGIDDAGSERGEPFRAEVPAGAAREFTAASTAATEPGLEDMLGDGQGKWRLLIEADRPVVVMNLLESPGGHVTNLSAARSP